MADAVVAAHAARHVVDVAADPLADVGHLVDEAHLGREERVGGVFDQLGRNQVGTDKLDAVLGEGAVELIERSRACRSRCRRRCGRASQSRRSRCPPSGIGVRRDVEGETLVRSATMRLTWKPCRRHGRVGDDDGIVVERAGDSSAAAWTYCRSALPSSWRVGVPTAIMTIARP